MNFRPTRRMGLGLAAATMMVVLAVAACGGPGEQNGGNTESTQQPAAVSSPAPSEPGPNPTATADAPARASTTTEAPTSIPIATPPAPTATKAPTPASTATRSPTPTPTAAPAPFEGHGFGGTVTLDGETYELWCPQKNKLDEVRTYRKLLILNCKKSFEGGLLALMLHFSDYTVLDEPFEFTGGPGGAYMDVIGFQIDAIKSRTIVRHTTQAGNLQAAKLSGTYDVGTGRVGGTFEAVFTKSDRSNEGEGMVSGSFDLAITW